MCQLPIVKLLRVCSIRRSFEKVYGGGKFQTRFNGRKLSSL